MESVDRSRRATITAEVEAAAEVVAEAAAEAAVVARLPHPLPHRRRTAILPDCTDSCGGVLDVVHCRRVGGGGGGGAHPSDDRKDDDKSGGRAEDAMLNRLSLCLIGLNRSDLRRDIQPLEALGDLLT